MTGQTRRAGGMVYIHSAPTALCSHIEWAVGAAVDLPEPLIWQPQPVAPGCWRAEVTWGGDRNAAEGLVSTLASWGRLRFELTVEEGSRPHRWSGTPDLGVFSVDTDEAGSVLVDEMRLRAAMARSRGDESSLTVELSDLLGEAWDVELEAYRACDPDLDLSWLGRRVG